MIRAVTILLFLAAALSASGCGQTLRSPLELEPASLERYEASSWAAVLSSSVDQHGRVDYAGLARHHGDLDRFVAQLGAVGPGTRPELFPSREDRLAYYLNAYNAFTIFNVLSRPGISSVVDTKLDFFYSTRFVLDGEELSLYALESEVIRAGFAEPRIHFVLNCASGGCPRLPVEPFSGERLEAQLAAATAEFLTDERNVRLGSERVSLSAIFDWFREDFPPDPVSWINAQAPALALPPLPVDVLPYDWSLNTQ